MSARQPQSSAPPAAAPAASAALAPVVVLVLAVLAALPTLPAAAQGPPPAPRATLPAPTSAPAQAPWSAAPPSPGQAVGPTSAGPTEDIRDIRGPKYVANPWLIPALLGALVLAGLGVYGLWRWQRRRRRPRILAPFEIALQRLNEIRPLMQPPSAREFSTAASDIIRSYIEQRFDVTATHRTTEEFLHDLLTSPNASLARHRGLLEEFLSRCDLVKFAGIALSQADIESLHDSACQFVRETAVPDPPAPPATPAPAPAHTGT